jgi:hypothetical protein
LQGGFLGTAGLKAIRTEFFDAFGANSKNDAGIRAGNLTAMRKEFFLVERETHSEALVFPP